MRRTNIELEAAYAHSPVGLAVLDTELRFVRVNDRMAAMNGLPAAAHIGRTVREVLPALSEQAKAAVRKVLDTGELLEWEIEGETPADPGTVRVWNERWAPLRNRSGRVIGVNVVAEEVTARKGAESRRQVLQEELHHRLTNTLATVQSIAAQTFRSADANERDAFTARLTALSQTHELLTREQWSGAELSDLLDRSIAPHRDRPDRFRLDGPQVRLPGETALALALALHELCTNAVKYGALSISGGQVGVAWTVESDGDDERLTLRWKETGGPTVVVPQHRGFGSRLIERVLAGEVGGGAALEFQPEGVACRIQARL